MFGRGGTTKSCSDNLFCRLLTRQVTVVTVLKKQDRKWFAIYLCTLKTHLLALKKSCFEVWFVTNVITLIFVLIICC